MLADGYHYLVRCPIAAQTAAKTLIQVKPSNAALMLLSAKIYQTTKTSASELLQLQISVWTGAFTAGTVTSATPVPLSSGDPAALAVGGTAATGTNATGEPSGGTQNIVEEDVWNVLNGSWSYLEIPEGRIFVPRNGLLTFKLATAPAASMSIGAYLKFVEFQ